MDAGAARVHSPLWSGPRYSVHRYVVVLSALLSIGVNQLAHAQDDGYHVWLRDHLIQEYGISGGEWILGNQEAAVLSLAELSGGVTKQTGTTAEQEFSRVLTLTVTQASANPWDRAVRFPVQQAVEQGDAMLLCVWLRHVWPKGEQGLVETVFEIAASPYTKSLNSAYNVPEDWALYLLPFRNELSVEAAGARFQLNMGRRRQITDLGGLALLNFGKNYHIDELPTLIPGQSYDGRDPDAPWRTSARERIEQFRMNDVSVTVIDESGEPLEGAHVHVKLKRHAFGFGTAVASGQMIGSGLKQEYRDRLEDLTGDGRTFNIAVLENALKWEPWESNWPVSKNQKVTVVNWLRSRGMAVRGHNLVWPHWRDLPDDVQQNQNDLDYVLDRIRDHIRNIAGYRGLKGALREWDVINEPTHTTDLRDVFAGAPGYPTGEEIYTEWFHWAKEADPEARLFVNDYGVVSAYGPNPNSTARPHYKRIIQDLLDAQVRLDGIGIQAHMGNPLTPIDTVYKVLDEFSTFGLGISISEYDAPGVEEDVAADYMRDFLTTAFSHPAVESFLMWGFWDGAHWFDDAPIYREDWSIKPSGQVFIDLVFDEWWTDETGITDPEGTYTLRGFHGDYEVTVSHEEKTVTTDMTLSGTEPTDLVVSLAATVAQSEKPDHTFRVGPNFPNPFAGTTSLTIAVPRSGQARIDVFDVGGRVVAHRAETLPYSGEHTVTLDIGSVPAGMYFYRLVVGSNQHNGYFTHLGR